MGMADEDGKTIVVLHAPLTFALSEEARERQARLGTGRIAAASVFDDQPSGEFKTNPRRKRLTLTADDVPTLLRQLADVVEQEGTLGGILNLREKLEET